MRKRTDPAPALLEVRGLAKSFGALRALVDVDFTLRGGEIHAPLGENGADKSTMIYQKVNLLPNLSVTQNLFPGRQPTRLGVVRQASPSTERSRAGGRKS
jgi:galactofuranose transport system ATP-binding protein